MGPAGRRKRGAASPADASLRAVAEGGQRPETLLDLVGVKDLAHGVHAQQYASQPGHMYRCHFANWKLTEPPPSSASEPPAVVRGARARRLQEFHERVQALQQLSAALRPERPASPAEGGCVCRDASGGHVRFCPARCQESSMVSPPASPRGKARAPGKASFRAMRKLWLGSATRASAKAVVADETAELVTAEDLPSAALLPPPGAGALPATSTVVAALCCAVIAAAAPSATLAALSPTASADIDPNRFSALTGDTQSSLSFTSPPRCRVSILRDRPLPRAVRYGLRPPSIEPGRPRASALRAPSSPSSRPPTSPKSPSSPKATVGLPMQGTPRGPHRRRRRPGRAAAACGSPTAGAHPALQPLKGGPLHPAVQQALRRGRALLEDASPSKLDRAAMGAEWDRRRRLQRDWLEAQAAAGHRTATLRDLVAAVLAAGRDCVPDFGGEVERAVEGYTTAFESLARQDSKVLTQPATTP